MGFRDPKTPTDAQRFWFEHELTRLNASERAGHNVAKERAAILRELSALDDKGP